MSGIARLGRRCTHNHRHGVCHGRSATESSYYTSEFATEVGAMILDNIEEQLYMVCVMEDENRERDEEDLGHDGGDEQGCRGG
eukprot:4606369-Heterocapsa_arctica.AAC.1